MPGQITVALALTDTPGVINGFMVNALETPETTEGEAHSALLVKLTDTTSPPVKLLVEKVFWLIPTGAPSTNH